MNVFVSVPILEKPEFKMLHSLYQSILTTKKHQVRIYVNENDSLISRVRNVHISMFLNEFPECEYFCSIDSDIEIVNCFATNNIFDRLIEADKDFIGGLYALKQFEHAPRSSSIVMQTEDMNEKPLKFNSGIIEMVWLSSGCWMIKRSALEKMVAAYPELTYVGDDNVAGKKIHGLCIPAIFQVTGSNGEHFNKYLSEDWAFCARWAAIGGKIYADTGIVLKHWGKIPYALWNVEVVAKKKEDGVAQQVNPARQIAPTPINLKNLPPVGFDLSRLNQASK